MADITYSKEVLELISIQKGLYLLQDFADKGMITSDDLDKFKKELNDKSHASVKRFIDSIQGKA